MASRYRKKPVVIEAMQYDGTNWDQVFEWVHGPEQDIYCDRWDRLVIETLEGEGIASIGDWVICGVKGEFYPCKPEIFEATYEPA